MYKKALVSSMWMFSSLWAEIPEPYRSIHDLPFDSHGWFLNAKPLEALIKQTQAKVIVEVGSWLGLSTRFMAERLPEEGIVYAVDTWLGTSNEPVHMRDPRLSYLFQQFLSNVKAANLTEKIVPIRMNSVEAAKALNVVADLIYIDAAHDTPSVISDILNWFPHLSENGTICGDDWTYPPVQHAVMQCADQLNKKISYDGRFWWFY